MNVRLNTTACCIAISALLLTGCASGPTTSSMAPESGDSAAPVDITNLPQRILPGARPDEVRSLAMGAARSKGWKIGDSSDGRLIVSRPADSSITGGTAPGSTLEVTSFFMPTGGGVNVASKAELVSPAMGGQPPARLDYTETFRDSLTQSLVSLGDSWSRHRERLARATPPVEGWKDPWAGTPYAAPAQTRQPADEPLETARVDPPAAAASLPPQPAPMTSAPAPRAPVYSAQPAPVPAVAPASRTAASPARSATGVPIPTYRRPAPEPRYRPSSAAPVVDASSVIGTQRPSDPLAYEAPSLSSEENMMAMPETRTSRASQLGWSANAEQYARQRGCQVSPSGAQLIESRQDGEVHKVPCDGSDSFLVRCQNGTCQGLL